MMGDIYLELDLGKGQKTFLYSLILIHGLRGICINKAYGLKSIHQIKEK